MIAAPAGRVQPPLDMKGNQLAFFENCVERATALAATCGWLAFGGGAEAAVGVAIGAAGLAAVVTDTVRRHGPESEAALKSIRKHITADLAAHAKVERWDTRADLEAADAAMERALAGCFLDRKALAASARSPEGFPGSATKLILARLAEREPATFGQDGPRAARDFADLVVRTALEAAIENESYFKNLQPHLLMETLRGLGTVEEQLNELHEIVVGHNETSLKLYVSSVSQILTEVVEAGRKWEDNQNLALRLAEEGKVAEGRDAFFASARCLGRIVDLYRANKHMFNSEACAEIDALLAKAEADGDDQVIDLIRAVQAIHFALDATLLELRSK